MKSLSGSKLSALIPFAMLVFVLSSCMKETINMNKISNTVDWPVSYGMPVATGNISLGDIVSAVDDLGLIKEDKNGLLYMLYRDTILSQTAENLLTIPTQTYQQGFGIADKDFPPVPGVLDSVKVTRDTTFVFGFNRNDVEIDSIFFKAGYLNLASTINLPFVCRIDIVFPTFKKNGNPLTIPIRKNNTSASYTYNLSNIDIAGYKLSFTKKGASANLIQVRYNVVIINSKGVIPAGKNINTSISLNSGGFSAIFGYLGQINNLLNLVDQKLTIGFFSGMDNLNVQINNPEINLYIQNSFGIPVRTTLSNLRTVSDKSPLPFLISVTPNLIDFKYPTIAQFGQVKYDTIHLVSNDIFNAIQTSPHYFYYSENATTNPLGKTGSPNFFMDNSKITASMELKIPFDLKATNLGTSDTIDFDLSNTVSDWSVLKKLTLYNTFINSIPFDLNLQLYLTDANKVIIDSVFSVKQPLITNTGTFDVTTQRYTFPTGTTPSPIVVIYDETRSKRLEKVKYAILKVSMRTTGTDFVKFYSDYKLKCYFQVQTNLGVKSLNQF